MSVGFPGLNEIRMRPVRATPNPLDKATLVSIYPMAIHEVKPTSHPGIFDIPAGTYDNPSVTIIGTSSWFKDVGENQPPLEIPNSAVVVAESVINDYCNGLIACNMGDCKPGLFFVPGEISQIDVKIKYKALLDAAKAKQDNWYRELVKMGDILWARTNGNPLAIDDNMRMGAKALNLLDKEWLRDIKMSDMIRCPACGTMIQPGYPVCGNCKAIINAEQAKKLNIQFAG